MHLVTLVVVVGASIVVTRSFAQEQNSASSLDYDRDVKRSYLERLIRNRDMVFVRRSLNNLWKRMTPEERLQLLQRYPPVNQNPDEVTTLSPTDNQQQQRPAIAAAAVPTSQQQQQPSPQIFAPTSQQQQPSPQMNLLANVLKLVAANFLGPSGAGGGGLTSSVVQPPAVVAPPPPPAPPPEQPNPGDNLLGSLMTGRLGQVDWIGSLLGTKDQFGAQEGNALAQLFQGSGLFG